MFDAEHFPRVKVCGLARARDVAQALEAGAEALGFVLHPASPRCVAEQDVPQLIDNAPGDMPLVAVLVTTTPREALELLQRTGLNAVQLCGAQPPQDWVGFPFPVLRRVPVDDSGAHELESWRAVAAGFVLDHPATAGGSGRTVDVSLARKLCNSAPCLLAGGLHANNVAAAVRDVQPRGVDASSRLELSPGIKDPRAVTSFVSRAMQALAELQS